MLKLTVAWPEPQDAWLRIRENTLDYPELATV